MNALFVFVGVAEVGDVGVAFEMVHDLHFALDILNVLGAGELALGDGLACEGAASFLDFSQASGTELATAKDLAEIVIT